MARGRQQGFAPRPQIIKVRQESLGVNRQTDPAVNSVNSQSESPYTNANLIEDIEFTVGSGGQISPQVKVNHRLGREYRGWHVVRNSTPLVTYFEDASNNTKKDTQIVLQASFPAVLPSGGTFKMSITVF